MPPVIFVHGSPGSWDGWAQFLNNPELNNRFHLIALDRPGYGKSTPGKSESSLETQAADLVEAVQFNQSGKKAILVGHSLGGPVVARMALDYPEKVRSVVMVAASMDPELEETKWIQFPAKWFSFLVPDSLRVCNEEILALKEQLVLLKQKLPNFKATAILVHGEDDQLVPIGNISYLKAHLPADVILRTDQVKELNHFVPWKKPELIVKAILDLE